MFVNDRRTAGGKRVRGARSMAAAAVIGMAAGTVGAQQPDALDIHRSRVTGLAAFVKAADGGAVPVQPRPGRTRIQPMDFLGQYGELFGVADPGNQLVLAKTETDALGHRHTTYHQVHQGIEVFAGVLKVHQNAGGQVVAANGDFFPISPKLNTDPTLDRQSAISTAKAYLPVSDPFVERADLVIVDPGWYGDSALGAHLAYHVVLTAPEAFVRQAFFIEAHSGALLDSWNMIHTAKFRQIYDGGGTGSIPGTLARSEGDSPTGDADVDAAYDYFSDVYDYYFRAFGRDGIDDQGLVMRATVNSTLPPCPNAFWSGDLEQMVFCAGTVTDDVVGHELTHGVTQFTANLIYQNQPGQLNESFSDIFGELVDLFNGDAAFAGTPGGPSWPTHPTGPGLDTPNNLRSECSVTYTYPPNYIDGVRWLIGEDALAFGGAFRDMWDPTCLGNPDSANSDLQICSVGDNGGVHDGMTIPCHAFVMVTDGKSFNGHTVNAIGPIKSGAVWYRALTTYLTPGADFQDAYWALNQAAADLVGTFPNDPRTGAPSTDEFTADDAAQVNQALLAVEMDTPGRCGQSTDVLDSDPPAECATQTPIFAEDFSSGLSGWTVSHTGGATPYDWVITTDPLPFGRPGQAAYCADLDSSCYGADEMAVHQLESPAINLPASLNFPTLAVTHFMASELGWDGGHVKISVNGGQWQVLPASTFYYNGYNQPLLTADQGNTNPLAGREAFHGAGGGWGTSLAYLGGLVSGGESIRLRFDFGKDSCAGVEGWYVAQVRVYDCTASADCNNNGLPDEVETEGGGHQDVVVQHPSSHGTALFADADIGVAVAQRFTLFLPKTVHTVSIWGGYYPGNTPAPDDFTVIFHQDDPNFGYPVPGTRVSTQAHVPATRVKSGFTLAGVDEWGVTLALAEPVDLSPGTYWVEIFNDTGGYDDFFIWTMSDYTIGVNNCAAAGQTPGVYWSAYTFNMSIELIAHFVGSDCSGNGVPDECEPDCQPNGVADDCDIVAGTSLDVNANKIPDECDDCVADADCADALFCNGAEVCSDGLCAPGPDPCPNKLCDEQLDKCVDCLTNGHCDDGVFCNGPENCDAEGTCQPGTSPCQEGQKCVENDRRCIWCSSDADCDDGVYCNGAETCEDGDCLQGDDPCPGALCDEATQACADCFDEADCDDGVFCNGEEACVDASCQAGDDPCPDQECCEEAEACGPCPCTSDADCDDGDPCTEDRCVGSACVNTVILGCDDDDLDGVRNGLDRCPNTPSGADVDKHGCSCDQLDDDHDGVDNCDDLCPGSPATRQIDENGCACNQLDDDGDGVHNCEDRCPATAPEQEVDGDGCAWNQADDDRDGVHNDADYCPGTNPGATVDANGCSATQRTTDQDGDGVVDVHDHCLGTMAGETVDQMGCSASQLAARGSEAGAMVPGLDGATATGEGGGTGGSSGGGGGACGVLGMINVAFALGGLIVLQFASRRRRRRQHR